MVRLPEPNGSVLPLSLQAVSLYTILMMNETAMTLEQFTELINVYWDENREKEAILLAGEYPELYTEYCLIEGVD